MSFGQMNIRTWGLFALVFFACAPEFNSERTPPPRGTFGEEVYRVFCSRLAAAEIPEDVSGAQTSTLCATGEGDPSALPARLQAMAERRPEIVAAIDQIVPTALYDNLDRFVISLVPFYDPPNDLLPAQTDALAGLLVELTQDEAALTSLERLSQRQGYRPLHRALGVARPALAYPQIQELTTQVLDATSPGGSAYEAWQEMLRAAAVTMASAEGSTDTGPSTLELSRNLLFQQNNAFGVGASHFLARRDRRAIVLPAGNVPSPFVDRDGDGLADVGPLGRFLGSDGALLDLPAPFAISGDDGFLRDPAGRATRSDGSPLFQTIDVDDSLLAALVRETVPLLDPAEPALLDAAYAMPSLLGPPARRTEDLGGGAVIQFDGFDPAGSPLLDLVHAATPLLDDPSFDDALELTIALADNHEAELADLVDAGLLGRQYAAEHPEISLDPASEVFDDLIQDLAGLSRSPGLLEAVLRASADPASRRLGQVLAEMMRYSDTPTINPDDINADLSGQNWSTTVDWSRDESSANDSLFQQSMAIIHDLAGVQLCNKAGARLGLTVLGRYIRLPLTFDECELMQIDDVGMTFQQSIIGRARIEVKDAFVRGVLNLTGGVPGLSIDEILERESGIDGMTTSPTPQAMSRIVFAPLSQFMSDLFDPPLTRDGVPVSERHRPVTLAWEREFRFCGEELVGPSDVCSDLEVVTFFDALSPLLAAFDTGERGAGGTDHFAALVSTTHLHYATPTGPNTQSTNPSGNFFSHQDNMRAYEPLMAQVLGDCTQGAVRCSPNDAAHLFSRLQTLLQVADEIDIGGADGIEVLAAAGEVMFDDQRNDGLENRRGERTSLRSGGTDSEPMSPILLMTDALRRTDQTWATAPERRDAWRSARSRLTDQLLSTEIMGRARRFESRRIMPILSSVVTFLRARIEAHRSAGDLSEWAAGLTGRAETAFDSALIASTIRFLEVVQDDEASTQQLSAFGAYLMSESVSGGSSNAFDDTVLALADILQVAEDEESLLPLVHVLSEAIAPGARDLVADGRPFELSELSTEGSLVDATMVLLRELNEIDDDHVLPIVLSNLVAIPEGEATSPLEVLLDVAAEIHRAEAGVRGPLFRDDHRRVLENATEFLVDENHGLRRIYNVVQSRRVTP